MNGGIIIEISKENGAYEGKRSIGRTPASLYKIYCMDLKKKLTLLGVCTAWTHGLFRIRAEFEPACVPSAGCPCAINTPYA